MKNRPTLTPDTPMRLIIPLAATLAPLLVPPHLSGQQRPSPSIVEYVIPRPGNFPHDPAVAKDGTIWYTDQRNSYIGHLDPETG